MSRMSELHDDLTSIHQILLGQRKVAQDGADKTRMNSDVEPAIHAMWTGRIECINDLLLEFEAAGVVWPDNVVSLDTMTTPHTRGLCECKACNVHPSSCACSTCAGY